MAPSIRVTLGTDAKVAPKDPDSNNYEFVYEVRATEPKMRSSRKYSADGRFVSDLSISHHSHHLPATVAQLQLEHHRDVVSWPDRGEHC